MYPYQKQIIFKQIYLTYSTLTGTTSLKQGGPGSNGNKGVTLYSSELEPHHQIQFRVIPRTAFFEGSSYSSVKNKVSVFSALLKEQVTT